MDDNKVPKDSNPAGMTDFGENATQHEAGKPVPNTESKQQKRDQLNRKSDDSPADNERP